MRTMVHEKINLRVHKDRVGITHSMIETQSAVAHRDEMYDEGLMNGT